MDITINLKSYPYEALFLFVFIAFIVSIVGFFLFSVFDKRGDLVNLKFLLSIVALISLLSVSTMLGDYKNYMIDQVYSEMAVKNHINIDRENIESNMKYSKSKESVFKDKLGNYYKGIQSEDSIYTITYIGKENS